MSDGSHAASESIAADISAISQIEAVKKILEVVCRTTGLGFSAVARVTDKHWIACAVRDEINFGLKPGGELELETTICHEIRQSGRLVVIDHVAEDKTFCNHHTPAKYGFQSYISVPIKLVNGEFFGTLCAIDPRPARVNTPETIGMFTLFADLIAQHMDTQDRMQASEKALAQERKTAALRDQFMAIVGHDLRNPLGAILSAVELLGYSEPNEEVAEMVDIIQRSGRRMSELLDNVLDFARTALGGGISVRREPEPRLEFLLRQVIQELQTSWPTRVLRVEVRLTQIVSCDGARIAQVLSNLLANALTHGASDQQIAILAISEDDTFTLTVTNHGQKIPPDTIQQLFLPFVRGKARRGEQGLGLGLYIASEIAAAHRGSLQATSSDIETTFTLRFPIS